MSTEIEIPSTAALDDQGRPQPVEQAFGEPPVAATEEEAPRERQVSPRESAMAAILERREEARLKEMRDYEEAFAGSREDAGLPAAASETQGTPVQPVAQAPTPQPQPDRHTVDLGNGQTVSVTSDELINLARMGALANVALSQAQQMPARPPQAPAPQPIPQAAPQQPQPSLRDVASHIGRRISFGTPEDVEQAVADLIQIAQPRPAAPPVDPNRIVLAATQHTMAQMQLQRNLETISREFPRVAQDHVLGSVAAVELDRVRREDALMGRTRSDLDQYREACGRVEGRFAAPAQQPRSESVPISPAPQAAPQTGISARLERKRAAPSTPASASVKSGMEAPSPYPLSGSAIVDAMRKARGQPSMR